MSVFSTLGQPMLYEKWNEKLFWNENVVTFGVYHINIQWIIVNYDQYDIIESSNTS